MDSSKKQASEITICLITVIFFLLCSIYRAGANVANTWQVDSDVDLVPAFIYGPKDLTLS